MLKPGDIVVVDNREAHQPELVRETIEISEAVMRYPVGYPTGSSSIEYTFAQLKALLKKVSARTNPALDQTIADAIPKTTAQYCKGHFRNTG